MKKIILLLFPILIATFIVTGCSTPPIERNYYIVDYYPETANEALILDTPLPYLVQVPNSRVSRVYDRAQLVFRYSQHRIEYSAYDLWAVRLSSAVPDAITNHLSKYKTFATTQRDFLMERPQYEVVTNLNRVEMLKSDMFNAVSINMDISLRRADDLEYMVRHSFSREYEIFSDDAEVYAQNLSRIIKEEMDVFIGKVLVHFDVMDEDQIFVAPDAVPVVDEIGVRRPSLLDERRPMLTPEQIQTWMQPSPEEQLLRETKRDLVGMGRVFIPAMSSSDLEPFYQIVNPEDDSYQYGLMGESVYLRPGDYVLRYGSGTEGQMMSREISVARESVQIVEPDWAGLRVRIIDEHRNSLDSQYELFDTADAQSYGFGFGVLEEFGEQVRTWILEPGRYKLVLNNFPFNTLEDFTTVDLVRGELRILTVVVNSETNKMLGAGLLEAIEHTGDRHDWRFSSAIHGNISFNMDNSTDRDKPATRFILTTQLDNRLVYDDFPYFYTMHNLTDLGFTKDRDTDFRISSDSFKLRNTFVYYLSKVIGLYSRLDSETHFFKEYVYPSDATNYKIIDSDGDTISTHLAKDRLRIKPAIFPLVFREGVGFNIRPLNKPRATLNLRLGFGMRQDIYRDVYRRRDETETIDGVDYAVYQEIDSSYKEGTEISILANIHTPFNVSYNTTADVLIPFDSNDSNSYNWENTFTIRIIRQMAIDYKLNIAYNKDLRDYTEIQHNVFLRLTYFLY
jgi:uncharacterized lipoprotein YmbA